MSHTKDVLHSVLWIPGMLQHFKYDSALCKHKRVQYLCLESKHRWFEGVVHWEQNSNEKNSPLVRPSLRTHQNTRPAELVSGIRVTFSWPHCKGRAFSLYVLI